MMFKSLFKTELAAITFSAKGVAIVQQKSGRIKNQLCLSYPLGGTETPGVLSDDIFEIFKNKDMELVAFLQKAIRDSRIDTADVAVALPPKDLIIRFFEMPNIPKSELVAGINFEMKKYIPFKVEELAHDFQYRIRQKANIVEVILCGVKQDRLDRYINLFNQLNLNAVVVEPALFSLFRLLVIKNKISSQHRSYLILEYDREQANVLIAERGFPYFTRDIKLMANGRQTPLSAEDADNILFRLINEVRVSLDYYRRQFFKKDIDEMLIIAQKNYSHWVEPFSKDLGLKVNFVDVSDLLKPSDVREDMFTEAGRAFGASLRSEKPSLITLNLFKRKEKGEKLALAVTGFTDTSEYVSLVLSNFLREFKGTLSKGLIMAGIIFLISYGLGFSKIFPLEKELAISSVKQPPLLPGVDLSSLESIRASELIFLEKERNFSNLVEDRSFFYKKMEVLPRLMPSGIWLNNFSYNSNPATMHLLCYSYAQDSKVRSEHINKFVDNLKSNSEFVKETPHIVLQSYQELSVGENFYIQFEVNCEQKSS